MITSNYIDIIRPIPMSIRQLHVNPGASEVTVKAMHSQKFAIISVSRQNSYTNCVFILKVLFLIFG